MKENVPNSFNPAVNSLNITTVSKLKWPKLIISGLNQVFVGIRIDESTKRGEIDVLMAQKLNSLVLGLMSQ